MDIISALQIAFAQLIGPSAIFYALLAIGLNLHFGYAGLLNFGQIAFALLGGYGVGIMAVNYDQPLWLGAIVGIAAAACSRWSSASRHFVCERTIWRSSPSPRRRSSDWCSGRRRRTISPTPPTGSTATRAVFFLDQPVRQRQAVLVLRGGQVPRRRPVVDGGGLVRRPAPVPHGLPARPLPLGGSRAEGGARGRGRRPIARQERLFLQDAGTHPRWLYRRPRRRVQRTRDAVDQPGLLLHRPDLLRLRRTHSRRCGDGVRTGRGRDAVLVPAGHPPTRCCARPRPATTRCWTSRRSRSARSATCCWVWRSS